MHIFIKKFAILTFLQPIELDSIHLQTRIWLILSCALRDGDILRHSIIDSETHSVFHLFLNTSSVGEYEYHVDSNEHAYH